MIYILKNRILKGIVTRHIEPDLSKKIEAQGRELRRLIQKKFGRSLHIRQVDAGSCEGCESEIIAANNPLYDLQRFGINFVASPRHADCLLVTGALSRNMHLALQKTYAATPDPKFIVTCGDCAMDGGAFKDSYYVQGKVSDEFPVALHIPGCPPSPLEIIENFLIYLRKKE